MILPVGDRALLVELGDIRTVMDWHAHLERRPLPGQVEVIAAANTVLIAFQSPGTARAARRAVAQLRPGKRRELAGKTVTIDVVYDGPDLPELAEHMGLSPEALIEQHSSQGWVAAFGGFAPGFTYCVADPAQGRGTPSPVGLPRQVPRRDNPRTAVPAGSVALAGPFSAVYPRQSPGGWQLIGRTNAPMWNPKGEDQGSPSLLSPGDQVRYRPVRGLVRVDTGPGAERSGDSEGAQSGGAADQPAGEEPDNGSRSAAVEILDPGLLSLLQDRGRPGYGDLGVTTSGACDRDSAWVANDVLGNPSSAAVIENIGGCTLQARADVVVCVTGALATVRTGRAGAARQLAASSPAGVGKTQAARAILLREGQVLRVEPWGQDAPGPGPGLRHYIAVRGGFRGHPILGSLSRDTLADLGPAPLSAGDTLGVGGAGALKPVGPPAVNPVAARAHACPEGPVVLRCVVGPRPDWFAPGEVERFAAMRWVVTPKSNRVGLRLALPGSPRPLQRAAGAELPSEGMVPGSVQVPPSGLPVVFLADHPVTGGYPVIATVIAEDMGLAGQLAPGDAVSFQLLPAEPVTEHTNPP
ncbi:carboxyltransferase domain-containing protein, partial [Corynebacterium heidelbergense]